MSEPDENRPWGTHPPILEWRRHVSAPPGNRELSVTRITPLRLDAFEQLPKHARRCVFWEVDPSTLGGDDHLSDPEFGRKRGCSMVMLLERIGRRGVIRVDTKLPDFRAAPTRGAATPE